MLKKLYKKIKYLTILFNAIYRIGIFPTDLEMYESNTITKIYKKS